MSSDAVQEAYDGIEAQVYELMMGELLHLGGLASSRELMAGARIEAGSRGVDLCCGNGASMRMLVQLADVASMTGIELSEKQVARTQERTSEAGLDDRVRVIRADACETKLPDGEADFVWGEDAWCYVPDKARLVVEAVRIVKPGGAIAFTDWTLGDAPMGDDERESFFGVMRFPGLWRAADYTTALRELDCEIVEAVDTRRFERSFDLFADMFTLQLGWDVLKIAFRSDDVVEALTGQLHFIRDLGRDGKVTQSRIIARKRA